MPNWSEVLDEIDSGVNPSDPNTFVESLDTVRRKYLRKIYEHTGRNVIAYYSGFLQHAKAPDTAVNDKDVSGFMLNIHKLDRKKGLDVILHTPGGNIAATEALVNYLRTMFGNDIRAIIPQISMSAGTMIALSTKAIVMGKHSSLGPIDPQINGIPCQGVLAEFDRAKNEVTKSPALAAVWGTIISKYHPTFLGSCEQAIQWSESLVSDWLKTSMCKDKEEVADKILKTFADHKAQKSHSRHISVAQCKRVGINVIELEKDHTLQDLVLTVHHAFMHTFSNTYTVKIIENHLGIAYMEHIRS
jgi:ATP-dependent protease ClpP protease subunit